MARYDWATLYADASWNEKTGGGWAVWARSDYGRIVKSGPCPDYIQTSVEAELAAIYAGLYLVVHRWPKISAVLVRSDCQGALDWFERRKGKKGPGGQRLTRRLRALFADRPLYLRLQWVKGHRDPSTGTPSWLNNRCDELAKQARLASVAADPGAVSHHGQRTKQ